MSPIRYSTMVKSKDKRFLLSIRLQMIRDVLEIGIKPTARLYGVSKNTVKKWVLRDIPMYLPQMRVLGLPWI